MNKYEKIIAKQDEYIAFLEGICRVEYYSNPPIFKREISQLKSEVKEQSIKHPEITDELKEAIELLKEYPSQDDYVNKNFKQFMSGGNPDDNSFQLFDQWAQCAGIVFDFAKEMYDYWEYIGSLPLELKEQSQRLSAEDAGTPIQDALYATGSFTTDQCSQLTDGILDYINDAGMSIVKNNFAGQGQDWDKIERDVSKILIDLTFERITPQEATQRILNNLK